MDHPRVRLKAVIITPGTTEQVGLVRRTLHEFGLKIPVGAHDISHPKQCVSRWHTKVYGDIIPSDDAEDGAAVLAANCDASTTLVTGAALKNVGAAISRSRSGGPHFELGQMFIQGGFAEVGVVPDDLQLEKFRDRTTCPTFNLNGDIDSADAVLSFSGIGSRWFVSKNVCHRIHDDHQIHSRFATLPQMRKNQQWIFRGMARYMSKHPTGKKLHDPLAACCAIDSSIGRWAEVKLYRDRGEWGSRLEPAPVPGSLWTSIMLNLSAR